MGTPSPLLSWNPKILHAVYNFSKCHLLWKTGTHIDAITIKIADLAIFPTLVMGTPQLQNPPSISRSCQNSGSKSKKNIWVVQHASWWQSDRNMPRAPFIMVLLIRLTCQVRSILDSVMSPLWQWKECSPLLAHHWEGFLQSYIHGFVSRGCIDTGVLHGIPTW